MGKNVAGLGNSGTNLTLREQINELMVENAQLSENYTAMARASLEFDERGWSPLQVLGEDHVKLSDVQMMSKNARLQTNQNALLKRGSQLRASYVFGRGFKLSSGDQPLSPRHQSIIDDPINQQALFSESAAKKNERTLFTDGNFFVMYDTRTKRFSRVPLSQISSYAVDPDDHEIVLYIQRTYVRSDIEDQRGQLITAGTVEQVWYPTDYADKNSTKRTIDNIRIDRSKVIFHRKENDETGGIWGLPDCLPALPWSWAYSEYLKDGSKMLKALSSIAWQVKTKTSNGVNNAAAKVMNNRQVAATVVSGSDVEMSAMPRNNAVDLGTGKPLAAMAATAMEVSVDALLSTSTPSAGSSQLLDQSTLNAAYARQDNWEDFYERILSFLGVRDASCEFNKIIVDPAYRSIQSLGQAWQTGLFDPKVIQAAYAEELGIEAPGAVPDGVLQPNNAKTNAAKAPVGNTPGADTVGNPNATNVATSRGNSGAGVGDLTNSNNDNRDMANNPQ